MRADEPINVDSLNELLMVSGCCKYINQLRYERLMAKAEKFYALSWLAEKNGGVSVAKQDKRIAEAYKARARKIKEGM